MKPNKPNQDPLDEILESVYNEAYKCGVGAKHPYRYRTVEAVTSEAKQALLQWRSDYVMGLLPSKCTEDVGVIARMVKSYSSRDQKDEQITANLHRNQGFNRALDDIRAKNERGKNGENN